MNDSHEQPKNTTKQILLVVLLLAGIAAVAAVCMPLVRLLAQPETQEKLRSTIASLGVKGWFLFLLLQMLQIIVAFIPGEVVQLMAGVLYGTWGGLFTCLLGALFASAIIFFVVRKAGEGLLVRLFGKNKLAEYDFLRDSERIETVTFVLFLIPGVPKDLLTYLAGISRINPWRFLLLSTLARTPALVVSTMIGSSASQGSLLVTALLTIGVAVAALVGVVYRKRLMAFLRRHGEPK